MTNRSDKDLHEHCKAALKGGNLGGQTDLEEILYHSHELYTTGSHSAFNLSSEHRTTTPTELADKTHCIFSTSCSYTLISFHFPLPFTKSGLPQQTPLGST